MADCYIAELSQVVGAMGTYAGTPYPQPPIARQKIAIGANTQSAAFNDRTRAILLVADGACHYAVGENPTASAATDYLPANTFLPLAVPPGYKIAIAS